MDAAEIRQGLLRWVTLVTALYDEFAALYLGWYEQSLQAGSQQAHVDLLSVKMADHLGKNRAKVRVAVDAALQYASESASVLAGDAFRSKTTQSALKDLITLASDDITQKIVGQLQRDQSTLAQRRTRERLRQLSAEGIQTGIELSADMSELLYRPDSLGRRRKAHDFIQVELTHGLYQLTNTLTYALLLQQGETVCALDHALEGDDWIRLDNFLKVQTERMHPRSTLLIHRILET